MSNATTINVSGTGNWLEQQIQARQHRWLADEPTEYGGTDLGPTPYELLLSALGS